MNIKGLFSLKEGDEVKVIANSSGHGFTIGKCYKIARNVQNNGLNCQWQLETGVGRWWVSEPDLEPATAIDKDKLIDELSNLLEFLKDYGDVTSISKLEKEYRVYHILKEIKSTKSDFEKIAIISKYF